METQWLEWRPSTIQAPNETRKSDGERQKERHLEPIPSEQHLEAGGVEMIELQLELIGLLMNKSKRNEADKVKVDEKG